MASITEVFPVLSYFSSSNIQKVGANVMDGAVNVGGGLKDGAINVGTGLKDFAHLSASRMSGRFSNVAHRTSNPYLNAERPNKGTPQNFLS